MGKVWRRSNWHTDMKKAQERYGILCSLALYVLTAAGGCEQERRVPYIPPILHGWEQPYRGRKGLELHVFRTGALSGLEGPRLRRPGGARPRGKLAVLAWVLRHPRHGLIVMDTGLNRKLAEKSSNYLGGLLGWITEVEMVADEHLPAQMVAAGLNPAEVRWVLLSNLRFLHAGEAEAFKNARVLVSKAEHQHAIEQPLGYLRREFDEVESWQFVDVARDGKPLGTFAAGLDLFGDGTIVLIDAPGPTPGNLVFLVRLARRAVVLAGDLAPKPESVRQVVRPAWLADTEAWWDHIWRLKRFVDLEPALLVVPGHSTEPLRQADLPEIHFHERPLPTPTNR